MNNKQQKLVFLLCQLAIILIPYFLVWSDTVFLLGVAAIIAQYAFSLKFTGLAAAVSYILTYWVSDHLDSPSAGNLYVYWYLSYFGIIVITLAAELIVRLRKWLKEPSV